LQNNSFETNYLLVANYMAPCAWNNTPGHIADSLSADVQTLRHAQFDIHN